MTVGQSERRILRGAGFVPLLAMALTTSLSAQATEQALYSATEPQVPEKVGRVLRAHRIQDQPPLLDGVLDDAAWLVADSASDMMQWDPDNGSPMTQRTVVRVLYDERYVYVGAQLRETDPTLIVSGIGRRDQPPASDVFIVNFDTQHDHVTGYGFGTNPSGVQSDWFLYDDTSADREYNSVWEVETRIDQRGWTAEYRIPLSQMRFQAPPDGQVVWGFDFRREIQRLSENGQWIGKPRGTTGQVSRWGHIVFAEGLESPRRLEALPFALARGDDPATAEFEDGYDAGVDLRTSLGGSASLAATFNPDFGQVEADPAVLNLSVFESFFPEKRPFFLEDGTLFVPSYGLLQLFYSRRIGRRPSYLPLTSGDVVQERPDQTTILGATKLTGKRGRLTYGVVSAITSAEHALVVAGGADGTGTARVERTIEPLTSYSAFRLQRDFASSSNVGLLATTVLRDGAPSAFTGGIDYRVRWDRNRWQWNGHWAGSHAPLAGEHVQGFGGVSNVNFSSRNWFANSHVHYFSPDFRISDIGFLRARPDQYQVTAGGGYTSPDPGSVLRNWSVGTNVGVSYSSAGLRNDNYVNAFGNLRLLNFWGINANLNFNPERYDDIETRGGPVMLAPRAMSWFGGIFSDSRKTWNIFLGVNGGSDVEGQRWRGSNFDLSLRPSPRFQLSLGASYNTSLDPAQWISNRDVTGDGETDYVFGEIDSRVLNVNLRASGAVHRNLTFEAFLQPFVAVGDYDDFKRLARPKSFDFEPVPATAVSNPDFNSKSLRGTFVVRWEYLRGSTIFLVWNLQGADASRPGVFDFGRDLGDVFGAPRDNRFIIKANYWLSL
jgi:hypothetical protein